MRYLTKSRFKLALECPAKLNYTGRSDYVDLNKSNGMLKGLAEGGFQIGALAQLIYAQQAKNEAVEWHEITGNQQAQIEATRRHLEKENVTLFEPTIHIGNFLVRVDVLRKRSNVVDLIEVKSKSTDSTRNRDPLGEKSYLPYLLDIAFQVMVVRAAYPQWTVHSHLMLPDKSKTSSTANLHRILPVKFRYDGANQRAYVEMPDPETAAAMDHSFLKSIQVDEKVEELLQSELQTMSPEIAGPFLELTHRWADEYSMGLKIPANIGSANCGKCEFYNPTPTVESRSGFHECWKASVPNFSDEIRREQTVLGLFNDQRQLKKKLIKEGKYFLDGISKGEIGWTEITGSLTTPQRQWMQISGEWPCGSTHYFNRELFRDARSSWQYPYYFLDFEGARCALPFRPGQRPNAINAFQYSLHVMHENGKIAHKDQFLDLSQEGDPHSRLLRQLCENLGDKGTIFHWHHYEVTVLKELRAELEERLNPEPDRDALVEFIKRVTEGIGLLSMYDLSTLAADCYFHLETRGSSSIKKVLPAIMGHSTLLKEMYSIPIYGVDGLISSKNFLNKPMTWWQEDKTRPGKAIDPYSLLEGIGNEADDDPDLEIMRSTEKLVEAETSVLRDGSGAMMAYIREQSGTLSQDAEKKLRAEMLRYCELDTLAMVMVLQAWIDMAE